MGHLLFQSNYSIQWHFLEVFVGNLYILSKYDLTKKKNYWLNEVKVPETDTSCFFKEKLWNLESSYYNSHILVQDGESYSA